MHALVVLKAGRECSEEELIGFLRQSAGPLLTPKSIEFDSALPLTNLGKVDKKSIKLRLEAMYGPENLPEITNPLHKHTV